MASYLFWVSLSNTTGSQTVSGNITLNSPLRLQGGGGGGTGATNFPGNFQGSSYIRVVNGRVVFSGNLSNAGGFFLGEQGNTTRVTFNGTTTGVAPLVLNGAGTNQVSYTSGALPTGTISTNNVDSFSVPFLIPLDSSTINNPFSLTGNTFIQGVLGGGCVGADVGAGISATWAGPMSGAGGVVKNGVGILTLSNASNPYTGTTTVSAGTLLINGDTSGSLMNVTGGTLGGTGPVGGITSANGSVAPGNGAGLLTSAGNVTFNSGTTFRIEIGGVNPGTEYDRLQVTGTVNLGAGVTTLNGTLINGFTPVVGQQFTIIQSTGGITGTFAQGSSITFGGVDFTITYNANSVVLSVQAPSPTPTAAPTATPTPTATDGDAFTDANSDPDPDTRLRHRPRHQHQRHPPPWAHVSLLPHQQATLGPTNYADVGSAFAAINAGTHQGAILVSVTCDTVEPVSAVLNASGTGSANYTSVTVNPVGTRTVSGTLATSLIDLNGADNVTINGLGGGNSLTLDNTSTAATASTVHLVGDASNNLVTNCTIKGASSAVTRGTIFIDTGTTTGNIGNTFSNNSITNSGANFPVNGIFSRGTSATVFNSGTITQNNIQDYFSATLVTAGINLSNLGNSAWSITNNRLFQTADRVYTTGNTHSGIFIGIGAGYTISGNVIGFANSAGTGTTNTIGNSVALPGFPASYAVAGTANATGYRGINAAFTAAGAVSNIQGNTIAGHALYTSTHGTAFSGILVNSGNVNIGTTTGNTIGATSGGGGAPASIYTATTGTLAAS